MNTINTRVRPSDYLSIAAGAALLIACFVFWHWLFSQHHFKIGYVSEILGTPGQYSVFILDGLLQESGVALLSSASSEITLGDWLLVYGTNYQSDAQLLVANTFVHSSILSQLPQIGPQLWLTNVAEYKYLAIVTAGVLILSSGTCFKYTYTLIITSFLLLTLWHAGHVANVFGYLDTSGVEYYLLFAIVGFFGLLAYRSHDKFQISSRIVVGLLTFLYGSEIATWLGFAHSDIDLLLFIVGISFPAAITPLFAAYLLSKGFETKAVGDYMLLALAYALSFGLLNRNTPQHLLKSFNKKTIKHRFIRQFHQLNKRFKSSPLQHLQGKVTLAELLNKRSA